MRRSNPKTQIVSPRILCPRPSARQSPGLPKTDGFRQASFQQPFDLRENGFDLAVRSARHLAITPSAGIAHTSAVRFACRRARSRSRRAANEAFASPCLIFTSHLKPKRAQHELCTIILFLLKKSTHRFLLFENFKIQSAVFAAITAPPASDAVIGSPICNAAKLTGNENAITKLAHRSTLGNLDFSLFWISLALT